MTTIRQMTQKGDPVIRTQLASDLMLMLQASAKQNKRRLQDEFIKRLAATLNHDIPLEISQNQDAQTNTEPHAQMISSEMLQALQQSAQANQRDLTMEINIRLYASIVTPESYGLSPVLDSILNCKFSHEAAVAECKNNHQRWLYLYEMEKLKLYLQFSNSLPRNIKENFLLIDVKAATKQIKAELEAEEKAQENKGE